MLLLAVLLSGGCVRTGADGGGSQVVDGRLSMVGKAGAIDLTGKWAFWPNSFIDPATGPERYTRFERFPASWTTYLPERFDAHGYASYALTITGLDSHTLYAFRFPAYSCAARYFIDGTEFHVQGNPAANAGDEAPLWDTVLVPLPDKGATEITLVMHLSNFGDIFPAASAPVVFGSHDSMSVATSLKRILMIIPFGAILAMGAYFLSLFAFQREEYSSLWLGFLCIVFALRIVCYDEYILLDVLGGVSPDMLYRLGYLTFSLAVAGFCGFVRSQYPDIAKKQVIIPLTVVSLLYALLNLTTPILFFASLILPFQIFSLVGASYVLYVIFRAVMTRKDGAVFFLAGFFVFFVIIIRDIMLANRLLDGVFLAHFGILGIIGAMGLIIVRQFSRAFTGVEVAAGELARINVSLARFVPNGFLKILGKQSITDIRLGDNVRKDMCVMFISLGIEMPVEESDARLNMLRMFNDTLLLVNPLIREYGGFVDKYLAEGVMALFPDDPAAVVKCALAMETALARYNREREAALLPGIVFAAGIHRGSLMLGTIGEAERMDGTVISDAVNLSSRLRKYAVSQRIPVVVSSEVAAPLQHADPSPCQLVPHGEVRLQGKDLPVVIYEARGR